MSCEEQLPEALESGQGTPGQKAVAVVNRATAQVEQGYGNIGGTGRPARCKMVVDSHLLPASSARLAHGVGSIQRLFRALSIVGLSNVCLIQLSLLAVTALPGRLRQAQAGHEGSKFTGYFIHF